MTLRLFLLRVIVLFALLLVTVPKASAEYLPSWSYSDSAVATGLTAISNKSGHITFGGTAGQVQGTAEVPGWQMNVFYFGPLGSYGSFYPAVNTFDLTVHLTDAASGASGSLIFHGGVQGYGTIHGLIGDNYYGGSDNTPIVTVGASGVFTKQPQSLQLGKNLYTVSFLHNGFQQSRIGEYGMAWYDDYMLVQVNAVPEPSTFALAATGLAGLGLRQWRQRRRRHAV